MVLGSGDLDHMIEQLKLVKKLQEQDVKALCLKAKEILGEEGNVQNVQSPIIICGDIHGQIFDLL
jgi:serine/threonine-protein phosphatase 4 catalytic subunit